MPRHLKLAGFLLLLAAMFAGAHVAGAVLAPVTTGHSQVSYTGTGTGGGMDMGAAP